MEQEELPYRVKTFYVPFKYSSRRKEYYTSVFQELDNLVNQELPNIKIVSLKDEILCESDFKGTPMQRGIERIVIYRELGDKQNENTWFKFGN